MANRFTISTTFAAVDRISKPVKDIEKNVKKTGDAASQTQGKLSRMMQAAGSVGRGLVTGIGAVAGVAAAAGAAVFKLAESVSNAGDNVAKTARYLGMTTDALQEYRYIAERSGLTTDEMDTALSKLTVNLSKDSGEISDALAMLGMSADQIKKAGPDEALNLIADGMAKITDPSQRAQIAVALFGKSGIKMTNVLSEGRAGMAALADEAHRVGYVMGKETLDASESLNDQILNMRTSIKAIGVSIAGQFMPLVESAVRGVTEFMVNNRETFNGVVSTFVEVSKGFGQVIGSVMPFIMDLIKQLGPIIAKIMKTVAPILNKIMQAFAKILPPIMELVGVIADMLLPVIEMLTPVFEAVLLPILETFGRLMQMLMPLIRRLADILQNVLGKVFERLAPFLGKIAETVGGVLLKAFEAVTPILTTFFDMLEPILDVAMQIAEPFLEIAGVLMDALAPALEAIKPLLDVVATLLKTVFDILKPVLDGLGSVFKVVGDVVKGKNIFTQEYANEAMASNATQARTLAQAIGFDTSKMSDDTVKALAPHIQRASEIGKTQGPEAAQTYLKNILTAAQRQTAAPAGQSTTPSQSSTPAATGQRTSTQGSTPVTTGQRAPVSSNTSTTTVNRSTVDVNFNGAPAGTTIRQTTPAPGVTVNTGSTNRRP